MQIVKTVVAGDAGGGFVRHRLFLFRSLEHLYAKVFMGLLSSNDVATYPLEYGLCKLSTHFRGTNNQNCVCARDHTQHAANGHQRFAHTHLKGK
jgi:hypothetical protein